MTHSTDALATPSERTGSLIGDLHPVTRLLVLAVLLNVGATLIEITGAIMHPSQVWASYSLFEHLAVEAKALSLSLSLFTGPAVVEFLFRIWKALGAR